MTNRTGTRRIDLVHDAFFGGADASPCLPWEYKHDKGI